MSRGGKRPNAGRKPGSITLRSTKLAKELVAEAIEGGELLPLDVHLANMRHYYRVAIEAERTLQVSVPDAVAAMDTKQALEYLMAEVKKTVGFRELADVSAARAAPYIHAKVASVPLDKPQDQPAPHPSDGARPVNGHPIVIDNDPLAVAIKAWGTTSKAN